MTILYHIESYMLTRYNPNSSLYDFASILDYNDDGTIERNSDPIHTTYVELTLSHNTPLKELKRLSTLTLEQFQALVIKRENIPLVTEIKDPTKYEGLAVVTVEGVEYLKKFFKALDINR